MSWNNGKERKKFEKKQSTLVEQYRTSGMTEEQIHKICDFDLEVFRGERIYYTHTQALEFCTYDKDEVICDAPDFLLEYHTENIRDYSNRYELEKAGRLTATGKTKWHAAYLSHMLKNSFYCGIITYHKQYTPDYLKQKKINNFGEIEFIKVKGNHTPIVTEEEFNQVQKIMGKKSRKMKNLNTGKHTVGYKPHSTAYGRLMICQCGKKFNQRFHSREGRADGVDYQCYTSINRGSFKEREKRGLSNDGHCDSPFIQGWKLEMMAEKIFQKYIENADAVMELSYSMLEKHISDQKEVPDYTDRINQIEVEMERLNKKRVNLIEMRAEGDIDKELFRERKQEVEERIAKLTEEVKSLQPDETKTSPQDYIQKLQELRERLKQYAGFEYSVIPENIVEAFIEKIWVSKDEFRWYLRSGNNTNNEFNIEDRIKIASFTLTLKDAKEYLYSFSTRRRVLNWKDLNVSVWI